MPVEDIVDEVCEDTERAVAGIRRGDKGSTVPVGVVGERLLFVDRFGREKFWRLDVLEFGCEVKWV